MFGEASIISEDRNDNDCSNASNNNTLFTPNKLFNSNNVDNKEIAMISPSIKLCSLVGGAPRVLTPVHKKHTAIGTNSNYDSNSDTLTPVPPQRIMLTVIIEQIVTPLVVISHHN